MMKKGSVPIICISVLAGVLAMAALFVALLSLANGRDSRAELNELRCAVAELADQISALQATRATLLAKLVDVQEEFATEGIASRERVAEELARIRGEIEAFSEDGAERIGTKIGSELRALLQNACGGDYRRTRSGCCVSP